MNLEQLSEAETVAEQNRKIAVYTGQRAVHARPVSNPIGHDRAWLWVSQSPSACLPVASVGEFLCLCVCVAFRALPPRAPDMKWRFLCAPFVRFVDHFRSHFL